MAKRQRNRGPGQSPHLETATKDALVSYAGSYLRSCQGTGQRWPVPSGVVTGSHSWLKAWSHQMGAENETKT